MRYFSEEHVWIAIRNGKGTLGISAYAAEELGEITFVELPEVGSVLEQGDTLCVVESAKAATDVITPLSGTVRAVNTALNRNPDLMNQSPETDGWICRMDDLDEDELSSLMSEDDYEAFIEGGGEE
ncbi:MAG: glycine cleavage system protein GcvH [Lentisphaeria bacterium]|nr:glycine cleavage system protein GcvH [Lentisphaeria bacterium]